MTHEMVTDTHEAFAQLLKQYESLSSRVEELVVQVGNLTRTNQFHCANEKKYLARIAELEGVVKAYSEQQQSDREKELLAVIARLEERLAKYDGPVKDSSNSSTPPSKENMGAETKRRTKSLRVSSGKKQGGQPGHKGVTLEKTDEPDETEVDKPSYCTRCGHSLEGCVTVLDYITQVISIPELKPYVKEILHMKTVCPACGKTVTTAKRRRRGSNSVTYDASVKALVVYLSVVMFLPFNRIETLLCEQFGLSISQGSIINWVNEAKRNAKPAIDAIKKCIRQSPIVGFDETGCYCNKKLDWAWIAQTVHFTLVFRAGGRGAKELEKMFGDDLERMIAVTDRHSAYFALHFLNHQVCLVHLLRELKYLGELNSRQTWSKNVESLFQKAIHERNEHPYDVLDKKPWLEKLDSLLGESLSGLEPQFAKLQKGLVKCRDYIFNFFDDPAIPPDNNASENGIRKLKIKLKNSGTFRSELGADAFCDIHSVVETTKKHGNSPLNAIRTLFKCQDED